MQEHKKVCEKNEVLESKVQTLEKLALEQEERLADIAQWIQETRESRKILQTIRQTMDGEFHRIL